MNWNSDEKMNRINYYAPYYTNQAGSGAGSFEGIRIQRGRGFFGTLLRSAAMPVLKYMGKALFKTGTDIASDVMSGQRFNDAFKARGKARLKEIAGDAASRALEFQQTGRGVRIKKLKKKRESTKNKPKKNKSAKKRRISSRRQTQALNLF